MPTIKRVVRTPAAANYVGLARATLEKMRVTGRGPRFIRLGRAVVYAIEDLDPLAERGEITQVMPQGFEVQGGLRLRVVAVNARGLDERGRVLLEPLRGQRQQEERYHFRCQSGASAMTLPLISSSCFFRRATTSGYMAARFVFCDGSMTRSYNSNRR